MSLAVLDTFNDRSEYILTYDIDPRFVAVCEPDSIVINGITTDELAITAGTVRRSKLTVHVKPVECARVHQLVVRLSGRRRGFGNKRFTPHTVEEMQRNNEFWDGWKKRA